MLQTSTSSARKYSESSSVREETAGAPSTASASHQAPPVDRPPRFYRSVPHRVSRRDSPSPTRPGSAADGDSASGRSSQEQSSLERTQHGALQTLALCRSVITVLELTRLRKSRTGQLYWLAFWDRLYERSLSRVLAARLTRALARIDALFRAVARDLHQLTQQAELAVRQATSEKEVVWILELLEDDVGVWRRRRRKKAQAILNRMRESIEAIPIVVSDELFDDMKRGVFALDVFCDYHPGDPDAEDQEAAWADYFTERPGNLVAVSPYLYRQWQHSAEWGPYLPLTVRTGNQCEEWVNEVEP